IHRCHEMRDAMPHAAPCGGEHLPPPVCVQQRGARADVRESMRFERFGKLLLGVGRGEIGFQGEISTTCIIPNSSWFIMWQWSTVFPGKSRKRLRKVRRPF